MPGMRLFSSHQHNSACNGAYEQQLPFAVQSVPGSHNLYFYSQPRPIDRDLIIIYYRLNVPPKVSFFCGSATLTYADSEADSPAAH